jgi:nucleotide-binding universal stress UspA family protein
MKTILVPVDFSAVSAEIVDSAVTFARTFGGRVILLYVIQPPIITSEYALPVEAAQNVIAEGENAAGARLAAYAKVFRTAGLSVASIVRHGPPVYVILEEAEKVRADFIIMGSHGHGRLYDLLVGSTANGVLRGAKCGVLIMPPADKAAATHRELAGAV